MADRFQFARGTLAEWTAANPVLRLGEIGFITDTLGYKIGDGISPFNSLGAPQFVGELGLTVMNAVMEPTTTPSSGELYFYAKNTGGRILPKIKGPSGLDTPLQPAIFANGVQIASPGSSTALSYVGMGGLTATGTVSHPTPSLTSLKTQTRRALIVSAATANSASQLRATVASHVRGNGGSLGGFFNVYRFSMGSALSTQQIAVGTGVQTTAIAGTVAPSSLLNCIFMGADAADTNLQLMYNDAVGTCSKIDLGSSFSKVDTSAIYELILFCPPSDTKVYYRCRNIASNAPGATIEGQLTTDIPSSTTWMVPVYYANNGGTAASVVLEFMRYYLETDY